MIKQEKQLPGIDSINLSTERPQSTNLISRKALWSRLQNGPEARARFVDSNLGKHIAFQIRAMRERENWSQEELAKRVGMNQNAISRLESPFYGKPTLTTLKRLATAFDVALLVRFAPFGELIDWVSGTPRTNRGLSSESLNVPSFNIEKETEAVNVTHRESPIEQYPGKVPQAVTQMPLDLMPSNVTRMDVAIRKMLKKNACPEMSQPTAGEMASPTESKLQNIGGHLLK